MAVKRRTIWLNDTEWQLLSGKAAAADKTPSVYLRDLLVDRVAASVTAEATIRPWPKPSQRKAK